MDFQLTEEQKMFQSAVRGAADRHLAADNLERAHSPGYPLDVAKFFFEQGLMGITLPEEDGGQGGWGGRGGCGERGAKWPEDRAEGPLVQCMEHQPAHVALPRFVVPVRAIYAEDDSTCRQCRRVGGGRGGFPGGKRTKERGRGRGARVVGSEGGSESWRERGRKGGSLK